MRSSNSHEHLQDGYRAPIDPLQTMETRSATIARGPDVVADTSVTRLVERQRQLQEIRDEETSWLRKLGSEEAGEREKRAWVDASPTSSVMPVKLNGSGKLRKEQKEDRR